MEEGGGDGEELFSVQQALGVAFTVALKQQPWRQPSK